MKKLAVILFFLVFLGCDSESAMDCLQTTGAPVVLKIDLPEFDEILVFDRIKLYLTYGTEQKVLLKTGGNLVNEVEFSVKGNKLIIKNLNKCNLVRDYKTVNVYVTSPNLTYIKNGSQWTVESTNILEYPDLKLVTEVSDQTQTEHADAGFDLKIASQQVKIVNNGDASYYLSGTVEEMFVGFYSGDGRFQAPNLIVDHLEFYHRSSNLFIVDPRKSLRGEIRSTGNVISLNRPPVVKVEEFYTGRLIFEADRGRSNPDRL